MNRSGSTAAAPALASGGWRRRTGSRPSWSTGREASPERRGEVPGRPADRGLPERALRRPAACPRRCACPARRSSCPGTGIARELSLPEESDSYRNDYVRLLPRAQRRAAQPAQRPPHHRGDVPRRGGRPADPRRQEGRPPAGLRGPLPPRPAAAGRAAGRAVHGQPAGARAGVRLAAAAADRLPRGARRRAPRRRWRSASSRRAAW